MRYYINGVLTNKKEFYDKWEEALHKKINPSGVLADLVPKLEAYNQLMIDTIDEFESFGKVTIDDQTFSKSEVKRT